MKIRTIIAVTTGVLGVIALGAAVPAARQATAAVALRQAMDTETVKGDLAGAIKQYEAIVSTYGKTNRPVAAQALLRMAEAYQKQGDAQAQRVYARIVAEFADQAAVVAEARTRIGPAATASPKGDRAVWTGSDVDLFGTVSPDGHYLTYVDWGGLQNVMLRDLVAGTSRPLTPNTKYGEFGYGDFSAISKDGGRVAYSWQTLESTGELRVASLKTPGVPAARVIRRFEARESARPFDWSPDGKSVVALIEQPGGSSRLAVISVEDGSLRQLKSIDWRGVDKAVFSPDGRFVAYSIVAGEARDRTHVYVMAVDASREAAVVEDASRNDVMGWTPDGRLLFASDRSGALSLWTMRMAEGRPLEAPRLVKEHVGSSWSLGLSASGTLYVWQRASATYVKVLPLDPNSGRELDSSSGAFQRFIESRGRPHWSADGRYLLFESCGPSGGGPCTLFLRSSDTGDVRQIPHALNYLAFPRLAPDGHAVVARGTDLKGRQAIFVIDVKTGQMSDFASTGNSPEWSTDGRSILYQEPRGQDVVLLKRVVGSSEVTEIFRTAAANIAWIRLSPDGRHVGFVRWDPTGKASTFNIAAVSGGEPHVLMTEAGMFPLDGQRWQWTPGSQGVFVTKRLQEDQGIELWYLPLSGTPRKLDVDGRQWTDGFSIHPDGRQVAFTAQAGKRGAEVWALENFLPATTGKP